MTETSSSTALNLNRKSKRNQRKGSHVFAGDVWGVALGFKEPLMAVVFGGSALFPSLRQEYADRGLSRLQYYATADLGNITYARSVVDVLKLKGAVSVVEPGSLPKDGLVIEDQRSYD